MDGHTLHALFGSYDNSGEPQPLVNRKSTILGVIITFATFSGLCVLFRLYTRARLVRSMGWDDVFVILSLLSTISASTAISFGPAYGMGKHIYELSAQQVQNYLRTFYIANAFYQMSTAFIKISLLFQYLRIFDQPCFLRHLCIGLNVFIGLWGLAYSILAWVPCVPIRAYWDWSVPATRWAYGSLDSDIFSGTYESHSSVNVFLDLVVLAIPVPLYFRPNVPLKSRLGLLALLGIGIAVNAVSIVRLITIVQHRSATVPTLDPMWYGPISIVLSAVEIDLAMVASSVPIFWPVLRDAFPGIFVTKEIEVTREVRRLDSVKIDDDGMELEPDCHRRSRVGSEASLRQEAAAAGTASPVSVQGGRRYLDDYVVGHVDPLRRSKSVVTQVKAQNGWWQSKGQDV